MVISGAGSTINVPIHKERGLFGSPGITEGAYLNKLDKGAVGNFLEDSADQIIWTFREHSVLLEMSIVVAGLEQDEDLIRKVEGDGAIILKHLMRRRRSSVGRVDHACFKVAA